MPFARSSNSSSRGSHCRNLIAAFSIAVCVRIWVTSSHTLGKMVRNYGHWEKADAVVVGSEDAFAFLKDDSKVNNTNMANTSDENDTAEDHVPFYCALLNYTTAQNEPVTTRSYYPSDCSTNEGAVPLWQSFEIRYNPDHPEEFIKQAFFADEVASLSLMIAVGLALTVALFYFACRRQRDSSNPSNNPRVSWDGDEELGQSHHRESPEERTQRILSKMIFQTVLEDLSNTTAEQMRALEQESANTQEESNLEGEQSSPKAQEPSDDIGSQNESKEEDVVTPQEVIGEETEESTASNNETQTIKEEGKEDENDNLVDENENGPLANGLLQMFSSWTRPEGDLAECCICLDKYEHGDTICCAIASSECSHAFHKDCVMDWFMKNKNQCPLCRTDLLS